MFCWFVLVYLKLNSFQTAKKQCFINLSFTYITVNSAWDSKFSSIFLYWLLRMHILILFFPYLRFRGALRESLFILLDKSSKLWNFVWIPFSKISSNCPPIICATDKDEKNKSVNFISNQAIQSIKNLVLSFIRILQIFIIIFII